LIRHVFIAALFLILFLSGKSQAPVANFSQTNTSGCAPLVVTFKDESTGNPQSRNWDFGNGLYEDDYHITKNFSREGNYPFTLLGKTIYGCKDTIVRPFTIFDNKSFAGHDTLVHAKRP